jgi:hypothetical protein
VWDKLATMHRGPGDERRVVLRHHRLFELAPTRSTDARPRTIVKKPNQKVGFPALVETFPDGPI